MRVIAGKFRSRRLRTLAGLDVRPTPDRLREALFNVLAPRIEGCTFVDAYAGSGAVGIEAISRGAARVVFVEFNPAAVRVIRANLAALGVEGGFEVIRAKAAMAVAKLAADIVFLDPPYQRLSEYEAALSALGASPPALVIAQHHAKHPLGDRYRLLRRTRVLQQGENTLSFFERD
jgi:16S rRNA (guanine966-N2)-methyltransferase